MGKKKRLSLDTKKEIANLLLNGSSPKEVIEKFNVSKSTISVIRKNLNSNEKSKVKNLLGVQKSLLDMKKTFFFVLLKKTDLNRKLLSQKNFQSRLEREFLEPQYPES